MSAPPSPGTPAPPSGGTRERGLVAVAWCRQVDNEAESPGYTTLPSEFPARKEALDPVRRVGNLAINATDTHDYWDPDPSSKLAFYPGLFLYPAAQGRYLCLGRLFLSTEDRPRLGMKTLILETRMLTGGEPLGSQLRRWYTSMGNPRRPDPPPREGVSDWTERLSEAFTFRKADPAHPLLLLVSDEFTDVVVALWDILERVPVSLLLLSGLLVMPYFLPVQRVNMEEFTETLPLTLAVLRIPRSEAGGDRHQRRVSLWSAQPVNLVDLTSPPRSPRGRSIPAPPVSWWLDPQRSTDKLVPFALGVDRVELPRVQSLINQPGGDRGSRRRLETARISKGMSAFAAVLEAGPRRSRLDAGTLSEARPYLEALGPEALLVPVEEGKPPPPEKGRGVPVPRTTEAPPTPAPTGRRALGGSPPAEEERIPPSEPYATSPELSGSLQELEHKLSALERRVENEMSLWLTAEAFDARVRGVLAQNPAAAPPPEPEALQPLVRDWVREELSALVPEALNPPTAVLPLEEEFRAAMEEERVRHRQLLAESLAELKERTEGTVEFQNSIRRDLEALDGKFRALTSRMLPLLRRTWMKLAEMERQTEKGRPAGDLDQFREELWQELHRVESDLNQRTREILDRLENNLQNQGRLWLNLTTQLSGLSEERKELRRDLDRKSRLREGPPPGPRD